MRNTIRHIAVYACILLLAPACLLAFAFGLPPQYNETYLAALPDKLDRLKQMESPRILVIGGSGAAFDVRSDLLEQEVPSYRAVNLGLYAGLGTTVLLDLCEPELRTGDIVLFLPEQSEQTLSTYFDATSLWQATDGSSPLLLRLNGTQRGAMLGTFPTFAAGKVRLFLSGSKPDGDAIYARRSFNAWGDMACAGRDGNRMAGGCDPNMPIRFDPVLPTDAFIERVNTFADACAKNGATLYFAFCPMNAAAVSDAERARADAYALALSDRLSCPILGTPEAAIWAKEWFFDTNFHLNASGQIAYTAQLARLLKDALGDSSPIGISVPAVPQGDDLFQTDGDNSDAACFVSERRADGIYLTGLAEQGKQRETLTVPAVIDGLPVRGFDPTVFANNATLRTVVIGSNVLSIADESFAGCTALERIVLPRTAPETCSVGSRLLTGTNATVVIPASAYAAYATNYFWSPYAARLIPDSSLDTP